MIIYRAVSSGVWNIKSFLSRTEQTALFFCGFIAMLKICLTCGSDFNSYNNKYCSIKCFKSRKLKRTKKTCLNCGKEFIAKILIVKNGGGKYCSNKCYHTYSQNRIVKNCIICNMEFVSKISSNKKMCSRKCYHIYQYKGGRKASTKRTSEKLKVDLRHQLRNRISASIRSSLRYYGGKNNQPWESIVGYNVYQLKKHLHKTMPEGYTWDDFLKSKLHIDHIIPVSEFNFTGIEDLQFKECWKLSNLRLLPARENILKRNKIIKPYQMTINL